MRNCLGKKNEKKKKRMFVLVRTCFLLMNILFDEHFIFFGYIVDALGKMDGRAGGFYQTGKGVKEKLGRLSTQPENDPDDKGIPVNKFGLFILFC